MRAVILLFALAGFLLPSVVMILDRLSAHGWWPWWVFYFWPTSYMLIPNSAIMNTRSYTVTVVSAILNALIYALIGLVICAGLKWVRSPKT
jgi:hypothetical protein